MTENQGKKRYRQPYKLVLLKEETLEEVGSYRLSPLNVYILVSSVLVITSMIVVALIFFTPLKRLVPGFADIEQNRAYMKLSNEIDELEEMVEAQQLYIDRFSNIVRGDSIQMAASKAELTELMEGIASTPVNTPEPQRAKPVSSAGIDYLYIIPPLRGTMSRGFDPEKGHYGVDLVAPQNTPVKAILDGYVIASDWTLETGNTIGIQHDGQLVSFYKHNARNLKKLGSFVKAGEAVAIIGNTGELSSGPHLHFELWMEGKPVDPNDYVDLE